MFGQLRVQPVLVTETRAIEPAITALLAITEEAQPIRWIEFPGSSLLFVSIENDPESGAFYVFDCKTATWFWIDFDDQQYGGYTASDFDRLIREYERPALLKAPTGWLLEPLRVDMSRLNFCQTAVKDPHWSGDAISAGFRVDLRFPKAVHGNVASNDWHYRDCRCHRRKDALWPRDG